MNEPEYRANLPQIAIAGTEITQVLYRGEPVVTFAMIDKVHQRVDGTAGRAYRDNRDRFVEGDDFIELTSDEIRRMSGKGVFPPRTARGTLVTRRGYLKIVKSLNDDTAWAIFDEMIDRYFAVERAVATGNLDFTDYRAAREHRLQFAQNLKMAHLIGLAGPEAAIAANQATTRATGFDTLEAMGVRHLVAPQNDALVVPSDIGLELGLNAIEVNNLLQLHGFQEGKRTKKGKNYWVPTEKGIEHGGTMVVVQRANEQTGSARQLKWPTSIISVLREFMGELIHG